MYIYPIYPYMERNAGVAHVCSICSIIRAKGGEDPLRGTAPLRDDSPIKGKLSSRGRIPNSARIPYKFDPKTIIMVNTSPNS